MPATPILDFAVLLRRYRRRSGLTQEELAERAGLSRAAISLLERGVTLAPQKASVDLLCAALALTPDEATDFAEQARAARQREGASQPSPQTPQTSLAGSLPVPLTTLIGREQEQATLLELLGSETTRLLTLTGPAGVGKTRLALELAAALCRERSRDVVFVGLIPVEEPQRVLPAIAQALGVQESDDVPLRESLIHALRDRHVLLLLDNFEQVLPAARSVLDLLIACQHVKALVTSRAPLNVRGEQRFPVSPLALADLAQMNSLDTLRRVPTVALFVDRASAVRPDFSIATLADGHLVASICARLDGLPLAIELAAARIMHFGLRQLHDGLAESAFLGVLSDGPQDLADHQRTMHSTIAWSYNLLGEAERRLFRWLGVFVGGATADAIAAVAGAALLPSLNALVNASLLQWADIADVRRYTQPVMLRAFAEDRLRDSGEWDEARRRHAEYFLALAELSFSSNWDQRQGMMAQVAMEYENMRAALAWAWETGATTHGLRMAGALRRFWESHSHFLEGLGWLGRFIERADTPRNREEQAILAEAWTGVLVLSYRLDRFERARDAGEAALALRREVGDKTTIAWALNNLANPVTMLRDYERAQVIYEECLALHREADNRQGMIFPLLNLGELYFEMGKPREALALYEESLALSHEAGESDYARGLTWNNIGEAYIVLDEPARAIEVTEPSYRLFTRENGTYFAATCAFTLGRAAWRLGDAVSACAYLDEAEHLFHKLGSLSTVARIRVFRAIPALERGDVAAARYDLAHALDDLSGQSREREDIWRLVERTGALACRQGTPELAAQLYAAAIAHRDAMPGSLEPAERELRVRDMNWLRATLGETAFANAVAAGEALTLDESIAAVRQALE